MANVDHASALPLNTEGMDEFERQAAQSYALMVGLDLPRDELLTEVRSLAWDAPVRKVRPPTA